MSKGISKNSKFELLRDRVRGMGVGRAYRVARKSGLAPWCSLRFAVLYGRA